MIACLEEINQAEDTDLLWFLLHEHHLTDKDIHWIKKNCDKNSAVHDPVAKRLAITICDALLEIPLEERVLVTYSTYAVTAEHGYCMRGHECDYCHINHIRQDRENQNNEGEKVEHAELHDETGLSG